MMDIRLPREVGLVTDPGRIAWLRIHYTTARDFQHPRWLSALKAVRVLLGINTFMPPPSERRRIERDFRLAAQERMKLLYTHRLTTPDGHEYILEADEMHTHAVIDEDRGRFVITWHRDEQAALNSIARHSAAVLTLLWQCDSCDVFDDTTRGRNGSLGDTDQCDTCIAEASRDYRRAS